MQKRIIGIIVVYSPEKAFIAVKKFQEIIVSLSDNHIIRVVCNNKELNIGDIIGSNHNAEFSGWDEGIATVDLDAADAVILANDTFCTRRKIWRK